MFCFASPAFHLILTCLPSVLLASALTPPLNEAGNTQQGSPQKGKQPAAAAQDPASLSPNEDSKRGKETQSDEQVILDFLNDQISQVEDTLAKEEAEKPVKNGEIAQKAESDLVANQDTVLKPPSIKADDDTLSDAGDPSDPNDPIDPIDPVEEDHEPNIRPPNDEAPLPEQSQGANVIEQKKVWPWKELGIGVASGAGGLLTGGLTGYYFGKSGSGNGSTGMSPGPRNETEEGEEASPNWQQIVYLLTGVIVILLILWLASIACWCCKTEDDEHSNKEAQGKSEGRQSRKSGKSKSKKSKQALSLRTPNSQTPSTIETLASTGPLATSDYGSTKKSVKSQMNMTPTSTPVGTPKSRNAASRLPSSMVSNASSVASSRPSVLSVFSSAVVSTASKIASKVTPKSGK